MKPTILVDILLSVFQYASVKKIKFTMNAGNSLFETYDDGSGQRKCYIEHFGHKNPNPEMYPYLFKIKRSLSFINEEDKGKEGAVLGRLNLHPNNQSNIIDIRITNRRIQFSGFTFDFDSDVFPEQVPASEDLKA